MSDEAAPGPLDTTKWVNQRDSPDVLHTVAMACSLNIGHTLVVTSADAPAFGHSWLERIYTEHGGEIYGFCRRTLGDAGLAEEVTQDAFLRAWRARDRFDEQRGNVRTWLFQIARNAAIDAHRARTVRPAVTNDSAPVVAVDGDHGVGLADRMLLVQALSSLSEGHRRAIVEVHVRGSSYAEAAQEFDVPVGTVKSRVFTGLRQLQDELSGMERQLNEPPGGDSRD
ncbi:MAG: RNA polymerase sigma factor [Acidimicrobiales bacterium]